MYIPLRWFIATFLRNLRPLRRPLAPPLVPAQAPAAWAAALLEKASVAAEAGSLDGVWRMAGTSHP